MSHKLSKVISLTILSVSLLSISFVGFIWLTYDYNNFIKNLELTKKNYILDERKNLKNEINRVVSLIDYNNSLKYNRIEKLSKQRVDEAHSIAINLYNKYKDQKSKEEIVEIINNTLRPMRFFDSWGYYFMYDLEGKLIMHGIKTEYEGTYKFRDFEDLNGKKVIQEIVSLAKTKKEGFLQWTFYRPDKVDIQAKKIGYVKLIEPLGYVIGTADYIFRIENELQKESLARIRNITYGENGYIFVLKKDGTTLVNKNFLQSEGKSFTQIENKEYKEAISLILEKSKKDKNGFIEYTIKGSEKLTYITSYEKWGLIIGTGKSLEKLNAIVKLKEEELTNKIRDELFYILIVLTLVAFGVFIMSKYFTRKINKSISIFVKFFKKVNIENKKVPSEKLPFSEFKELASCINEMLDTKIEQQQNLLIKDQEVLISSSLLNEYKKAVDAGTIVSKTNKEGVITYVNDEFCKISGYTREELIGENHRIVKHPSVKASIYKGLWKRILAKKVWKGVLRNKTKNGSSYYVKMTVVPILDIDFNIKEFIAIRYDVSNLIKQAKKIKAQTTDPLTKLPNRQKLLSDVEKGNFLKLAIFNLVRFKEINEYFGFDLGDKVLKRVANILSTYVLEKNVKLYRLQGDEFAILAKDNLDKEKFKEYANDIINLFKHKSFEIDTHLIDVDFIGGASFQKNYYINAEMSKNHAKETKQEFVVFDENLDIKDNLLKNINCTKEIKEALRDDRVVVYAQPIILNNSNSISKYECLVRIIDKEGKVIPPIRFLNIAKKSKMYTKITDVVITKAFDFFAHRTDEFSINLTLEDILNKETVNLIKQKLIEFPATTNRVIFEIVEDEGIENYDEVSNFIDIVKRLGCKIAIDDFGTGYSNFDYLMKLNVDYIKIDGSMIRYLDHDENAKVVTQLIVNFAKKLNIKTIGEFVHSEEIHKIVTEMGIDYSQGFYLGEPKILDELGLSKIDDSLVYFI